MTARNRRQPTQAGKVYLVGAGPGNPELITVRGLRYLRMADVVIYDRLVHPDLAGETPWYAEKFFAGKEAARRALSQADINDLMIDRARAGCTVVRLKGGDPFVFGRGGEEAVALTEAGIPWELVPGITSAVGVPALAGIPLTYRGVASSFGVVTGHRVAGSVSELDWRALASLNTLVVLMGVSTLPRVVRSLLSNGRDPETPVAVIQEGTLPTERVVSGTLASISRLTAIEEIRAPATIIVGEVVRLAGILSTNAVSTAAASNPKHALRNRDSYPLFQEGRTA